MITLIRWIILQQKRVKMKLAFYSLLEQAFYNGKGEEIINEYKELIAKELASVIHEENKQEHK